MANTLYEIFVGNYGSGKTELSLNTAVKYARSGKKTMLVDLDIVNPYFRSTGQAARMEAEGVTVLRSPYDKTSVEIPVISAEVGRIFTGEFDVAIVDVGGDPVGATALGRFKQDLTKRWERVNSNFVISARRPMTGTVERVQSMLAQIVSTSRIEMKWLINNTNLATETTAEVLFEGQKLVEQVSKHTGIPIRYISGSQAVLDEMKEKFPDAKFSGELYPITPLMRDEWMNED